jgi:outer membrane protein assembly factor BamB
MPRPYRPPLRVWVWTAATVVLVLVGVLLWRTSDVAATDSTTAAAPEIPDASPSGELTPAWTEDADLVPRRVVERGRVLLGGEQGVTALDGVSGDEAWHYTRSDARLCDLTAVDGVVVAIFRQEDRCDEVVALDAATGVRAWTRNVNFRPDVELSSTDSIVLAESGTGIVTLDPGGGGVRWRYQPPDDCRLLDADVGSTGVGVLQGCPGADEVQFRLFDGFEGDPHWTRGVAAPDEPVRLVGVDRLVTVVVADELRVHGQEDGELLETLPLPPSAAVETETLQQAGIGPLALTWVRGTVYALDEATGRVRWSRPGRGLPSVREVEELQPGAVEVVVPEVDAFVRRDLATGEETSRLPVEDLAEGGRTSVVGPVVVYRLPDEVLGYR